VGTASSAPYTASWTPAAAGAHALKAVATDSLGVSAASAVVNVTVQASPPPVVSLTSPAANATFSSSGSIPLAADAAPAAGGAAIAKVEFLHGSTRVGSATAAPYTATWGLPAAGTYSIRAVATDVFGIAAESAPVTVTVVDSPAPTVSLGTPSSGAFYAAPANLTLAASASAASGQSIARVEFYQGTTLIGTATAAPYLHTWPGVPAGSYSVKAVAIDSLGAQTATAPVAVTVGAPSITFTAPQDGAALGGSSVLVRGTVQAPANSGVVVNGVVALVDADNGFYAQVPLQAGGNAVTATVTAPTGQTAQGAITVSSDAAAPFLQIEVSNPQGLSPLPVTYTLTNLAQTDASVAFDAGAPFTLTPGQSVPLTVTYTGVGTVLTTISATDGAGRSMSRTFASILDSRAQLDQKFRAVWDGMNIALMQGDKATAMSHLSSRAQAIYGPVFDKLMPHMAGIVASFSTPEIGSVSADLAEYAITRDIDGATHVFLLYFMKDANGVWRLNSM
jgi:hypothetical protein